MKKSIAKIITKKVLIMLLIAVILLSCGAYYAVSKIVSADTRRHAETLVGTFSDTAAYLAKKENAEVNENFANEAKVFGDYFCKWYRIDAAAIYVPDFKNNTIKYISFSCKDNLKDDIGKIPSTGDIIPYDYTDDEVAVWNGKKYFAHIPISINGTHELMTVYCDKTNDNKYFTAVATNYNEIYNQTITNFHIFAAIIAVVIIGIYLRLNRIIKKKVTDPATKISEIMSSYIGSSELSTTQMPDFDSAEFSMISDAYNSMIEDIDAFSKQSAELGVASGIQQGFLPNNLISANDYYIQCMMKPAKNVGGDLYDYIELDENRTLMVIADVSGKGITAAMIMAITLILIREHAKQKLSPAEILEKINDTLSAKNPAMQFITAFLGIYDRRNKTFTYSNAGHNSPYIISDKVTAIDNPEGTVIGLFEGEKYVNKTVQLNTGDTLFMYTDGVTEVINEEGKFYGTEKLESQLEEFIGHSAVNIVDNLYTALTEFSGNAEQFDDITMLSLTIKDTIVLSLDYDIKEFSKIRELILQLPIEHNEKLNLCLAAEEIFVNICKYAFPEGVPTGEKVTFALSKADILILRFEDNGQKFNPLENNTTNENYDPDKQIGGLGIYITTNVVDEIKYDYKDNKNILSLIKNCEEKKK